MASRKHFSTSYVLSKLDVSDDDCFDKNDFDRESDDALGDVEPHSNVDSNATEDYGIFQFHRLLLLLQTLTQIPSMAMLQCQQKCRVVHAVIWRIDLLLL